MRAAPTFLLLVLLLLPACQSDPEPEPPPDRFEDVIRDGREEPWRPRPGQETPKLVGQVTAVDPEMNIVLLSVGRDDGVRVGYTFTVYRDDEYVTKVVVDKVGKDYCSAYSVRELQRSPPAVGDHAATRF